MDQLRDQVAAIVGAANVFTAPADQAPYVTDWRDRYHGTARMVVRPGSAQEAAAVVRLCAAGRVPMVPQGGNTGLCGAATPDRSGNAVVFRLDRMNRIRTISATDGFMLVEAGCVLAMLQQAADDVGLLFPLSLGAEGSCQIGGNISTNAGGTAVMRYGPTRDLVLGLEVVLPDGHLCDWLIPLRKNTTGYDLKQLFVGAEGTLGLITAASVKVFPKPRQTATAMVTLRGPEPGLSLLEMLRARLGDRLSSFEIINQAQAAVAIRYVPGNSLPFDRMHPWYLLIEVDDTLTDYRLRDSLETLLHEALEKGIVTDAVIAARRAQAEALWRLRHSVSEGNRHRGFGVSHDTAVPLHCQARFCREIEARMADAYPEGEVLMVGHMGDGNIHVVVMLDPDSYPGGFEGEAVRAAAAGVSAIVDEVTLGLGGTISAEHGIGQTNKKRLAAAREPVDLEMMRQIKRALDPLGLMNPGKVFDLA